MATPIQGDLALLTLGDLDTREEWANKLREFVKKANDEFDVYKDHENGDFEAFNNWCITTLNISFKDQHGICISNIQNFLEHTLNELPPIQIPIEEEPQEHVSFSKSIFKLLSKEDKETLIKTKKTMAYMEIAINSEGKDFASIKALTNDKNFDDNKPGLLFNIIKFLEENNIAKKVIKPHNIHNR